jgi:hypothetical protein
MVKNKVSEAHFHLLATIAWALLIIPTVAYWKDSVLWIAIMSWYANVVGHWSAYDAARAAEK